jgi:two-component system repressor protein LuxO
MAAGHGSSVNHDVEHGHSHIQTVASAARTLQSAARQAHTNAACDTQPLSGTTELNNTTELIGTGPAMQAIQDQSARVACSAAPVFITGESGTGKELCAHSVHQGSPRAGQPFVALNASAIPRDLIESEMFGHRKGAFTGATAEHRGAAQQADQGTLFLDEICEMDSSLQAKLLRFLQTGVIRPLGATRDVAVDVRIVCATNRDPLVEIAAGRFREDLYYRLHVLPLHLPPLRDRPEDILPLASHFLARHSSVEGKRFSGFDAAAAALLGRYDWPGNIRQLENTIRRVVVMQDGDTVSANMIPLALAHSGQLAPTTSFAGARSQSEPIARMAHERASQRQAGSQPGAQIGPQIEPFWQQEKRIIEEAIEHCGGHIGRAAVALELSPSTIYRKKLNWERADCGSDDPTRYPSQPATLSSRAPAA